MTVDTVTVHDDIKLQDDGRAEPSGTGQPKAKGHHHGKVKTAIVLQGGGALGAYEYGVLKALYEQRPGFEPIAVTGISIGAITAAVLGGAKGDPITALDELWRNRLTVSSPLPIPWLPPLVEQSLATYGNPGMYWLNPELYLSPYTATSLYDTAPLRNTLADLVDPIRLTRERPRVVVGAINVATGEMEFFDPLGPRGLTFDHVVASGSLPPGFPMTAIGEELYWDGGLFSNAPLGPAINALEEVDGDPGVARELIVVELFPMRAPVPRNLPAVLDRMQRLQYPSRLKLDQAFFDKINGMVDVLARVDRELPPRQPTAGRRHLQGAVFASEDRPLQRGHLDPSCRAVERLGLLPRHHSRAHPGRLPRRHRPGHWLGQLARTPSRHDHEVTPVPLVAEPGAVGPALGVQAAALILEGRQRLSGGGVGGSERASGPGRGGQ